jgi:hypothetical protein
VKDAESNFAAYLDGCHYWASASDDLLRAKVGELAARRGPTYPDSTVMGLKVAATVHLHAALDLIGNPLTAFSAEAQVRALLEGYSHMAWIHVGEPATNRPASRKPRCLHDRRNSTQRQRALCLELGIAQGRMENLSKISRRSRPAGTSSRAKRRLATVKRLHDSGCRGPGRRYSDVQPMLALLKRRRILPWAYDLWVVSSSFIHGMLPDRYFTTSTGTPIMGGPADLAHRQKLTEWSTTTYANLFSSALIMLAPGRLPNFNGMVQTLETAGAQLSST